jgi:hypothetical protein
MYKLNIKIMSFTVLLWLWRGFEKDPDKYLYILILSFFKPLMIDSKDIDKPTLQPHTSSLQQTTIDVPDRSKVVATKSLHNAGVS